MVLDELADEVNFFGPALFWVLGDDGVNFLRESIIATGRIGQGS